LRVLQVDFQRKGILRKHQRVWNFFHQRKASSIVASFSIIGSLGMLFLGHAMISQQVGKVQVQPLLNCSDCASSQVSDNIGIHHQAPLRFFPRHRTQPKNSSSTPVQSATVSSTPTQSTPVNNTPTQQSTPLPTQGSGNVFPYGSCTWWANQRYFQIHGIFVPWRTQSDAWEWTARAYQFGWHVSSSPVWGAIIDLQPGVQGAYSAGHVAVVEKILSNGHVIASNMSWGAHPWQVTYVEFAPGPGVTFIYR
jgi:N-acetylmuramoyl-L-alanine amidase